MMHHDACNSRHTICHYMMPHHTRHTTRGTDTDFKLLFTGRTYPRGYTYFRTKCHAAFHARRHLTNVEEIQRGVDQARYVVRELEALWMVRKYRAMKRRYGGEWDEQDAAVMDVVENGSAVASGSAATASGSTTASSNDKSNK